MLSGSAMKGERRTPSCEFLADCHSIIWRSLPEGFSRKGFLSVELCVSVSFLSLEVSLTKSSHNSFPLSGQVPYVGVWREEENYEACWNCCASVWGFDVCVSYHLRTYKSHLLAFFCVLCLDLSYTHIYSVKEYILELDEGRKLFTRGSMPLHAASKRCVIFGKAN